MWRWACFPEQPQFPVTSQAAGQGVTPGIHHLNHKWNCPGTECPGCLGQVLALPATMEGPGLSHPEASLVGLGWGVALSGVRCKFTLEFQLCYHVSLGSCYEGIPGWRKVSGGVWPQRTGPSTPPVLPSAHVYQSPWYQALG